MKVITVVRLIIIMTLSENMWIEVTEEGQVGSHSLFSGTLVSCTVLSEMGPVARAKATTVIQRNQSLRQMLIIMTAGPLKTDSVSKYESCWWGEEGEREEAWILSDGRYFG